MLLTAIAIAVISSQGDPTSALPINEVPARILPGTVRGWKIVSASAHRSEPLTGPALTTVEYALDSAGTAGVQATVSFLPSNVKPGAYLLDSTRSQSSPRWSEIKSGTASGLSVERRYAKAGGVRFGVAVWHGELLVQVYELRSESMKPHTQTANLDKLADLLLVRAGKVGSLRPAVGDSTPYRLLSANVASPGRSFKLVSASAGPSRSPASRLRAGATAELSSDVLGLRWESKPGDDVSMRATFSPSGEAAKTVEQFTINPRMKPGNNQPHFTLPANLPKTVNGKAVRWIMPTDRPEPTRDRRGVVTVANRPEYQLAVARKGDLVVSVELTGRRGPSLDASNVVARTLKSLSVQTHR